MLQIPGRIPIAIHPLFWLMAGLIGWINSWTFIGTLIWVVAVLLSLLVHEFGHALTALAFGEKPRIQLAAFGGMTLYEGRKLLRWKEFVVILNGPLAGLILAGAAWLLADALPEASGARPFLIILVFINVFWTILNLIPVTPLDGGRLLTILLEGLFGVKGVKAALLIGVILGVGVAAFFFIQGAIIIGALFLLLTVESFRSLSVARKMSAEDRDLNMQEKLREAEESLETGHTDEAIAKFGALRQEAKSGLLHLEASEKLAFLAAGKEEWAQAYDYLRADRKDLSPQGLQLLHRVALKQRDYALVADIGNDCYQQLPTPDTALANATAHAALGHVTPAIGWLRTSVEEGFTDLARALSDPVFDSIRSSPDVQSLLRSD